MNTLTISIDNIINSNGISVAVVGILIVFLALAIIALVIGLLPRVLPLLERLFPVEEHPHQSHAPIKVEDHEHEKVLAAIAFALFHRQAGSLPAE